MTQRSSDNFLRTIADAVPCLLAHWDRDLRCTFANRPYSEWFGRSLDQIMGRTMSDLLGDHVFALNRPYVEAALAGTEQKFERVMEKADGTITHAWVNYVPHRTPEGALSGFIVLVTDVTALRHSDRRDEESASDYRLLADHSSDMIFHLDRDHVRRYVSPACREILGHEPHELLGRRPVDQVHPDDAKRVADVFQSLTDGSAVRASVTNRIRHRDGHWIWVEVEFRSIRDPITGLCTGIIGAMRDVSLRKAIEAQLDEANRRLETIARQDGLTGIANRRSLDEALPLYHQQATREREALAVVMIDVDRFKLFNDRYGHLAGDACLRRVSESIVSSIRQPSDMVARYGGEEFVVLLPNTDEADGAVIANRIRRSVEQMRIAHEHSPEGIVTISAGVTSLAQDGLDALLDAADRALYGAKTSGRNMVVRSSQPTTTATSSHTRSQRTSDLLVKVPRVG